MKTKIFQFLTKCSALFFLIFLQSCETLKINVFKKNISIIDTYIENNCAYVLYCNNQSNDFNTMEYVLVLKNKIKEDSQFFYSENNDYSDVEYLYIKNKESIYADSSDLQKLIIPLDEYIQKENADDYEIYFFSVKKIYKE